MRDELTNQMILTELQKLLPTEPMADDCRARFVHARLTTRVTDLTRSLQGTPS